MHDVRRQNFLYIFFSIQQNSFWVSKLAGMHETEDLVNYSEHFSQRFEDTFHAVLCFYIGIFE